MYFAKNQDKYSFALSSADFCEWSGLGIGAYNTAFEELKEQGYLIPKNSGNKKETVFVFYDKSQIGKAEDKIIIEIPEEKVLETRKIAELVNSSSSGKQFVF